MRRLSKQRASVARYPTENVECLVTNDHRLRGVHLTRVRFHANHTQLCAFELSHQPACSASNVTVAALRMAAASASHKLCSTNFEAVPRPGPARAVRRSETERIENEKPNSKTRSAPYFRKILQETELKSRYGFMEGDTFHGAAASPVTPTSSTGRVCVSCSLDR